MKHLLPTFSLLAAPVLAAQNPLQITGPAEEIAITNVSLIPMDRPGVLASHTVVVRNGRIAAIGPSASAAIPAGTKVIDGRGRWLLPGLIDMHAHAQPGPGEIADPAGRQIAMYLAHGVTTMRSLSGAPTAIGVRDRIARGELLGPTMVVYSPSLNANSVPYAGTAGAIIAGHRRAGFDGLKVHGGFDAETYDSVIAAARREGMKVSGHVTPGYGLERAVRSGQQVEHLDGIFQALAKPSYDGPPLGQMVFHPAMLDAIDTTRLEALAREHAAAGIWHGPTMALFKTIAFDSTTDQLMARPIMRYVPGQAAQQQANARRQREAAMPVETRMRFVELRNRTLRALHRGGVRLMAGSDTPTEFVYVGDGLLREIEAFVEAGLPARAALEAATVNPAAYLGRSDELGSIRVGGRADLLLLDGNPLDDIHQIRRISGVAVGGRWLDREFLDRLMESAAVSAGQP